MRSFVCAAALTTVTSLAAPARADRFQLDFAADVALGAAIPFEPLSWRQQSVAQLHASLRFALELRSRFFGFAPEVAFEAAPWFRADLTLPDVQLPTDGAHRLAGARLQLLAGGRFVFHLPGDHAIFVRLLAGPSWDWYDEAVALQPGFGVELRFQRAHWLVIGAACDFLVAWIDPAHGDLSIRFDADVTLFLGARLPIYRVR